MIPVFVLFFFLDSVPFHFGIAAIIFVLAACTDFIDGYIARSRGLVTNLGKFLDPIADKFMVIGALFVILYKFAHIRTLMIFVILVIVFRELAVTSMRLVVSTGQNIVIAANNLGKLKTVSQIVFICTVFLEPVLQLAAKYIANSLGANWIFVPGEIAPLTYITMLFTVVMTVWSGVNYILGYWKYLDPEK